MGCSSCGGGGGKLTTKGATANRPAVTALPAERRLIVSGGTPVTKERAPTGAINITKREVI